MHSCFSSLKTEHKKNILSVRNMWSIEKHLQTHVKKRLHHVATYFGLCVGVYHKKSLTLSSSSLFSFRYFSYQECFFFLTISIRIFVFLELRWTWYFFMCLRRKKGFGFPSCIFHFRRNVWVNERVLHRMLFELKFIFHEA